MLEDLGIHRANVGIRKYFALRQLIQFGQQKKNNLSIEINLRLEPENVSPNIREEALYSLDAGEILLVKNSLQVLKNYIDGILFTDEFGVDHARRRIWEDVNLSELEERLKSLYESNQLGLNNIGGVIGFIDLLIETIKNLEIKEELQKLRQKIPIELYGMNATNSGQIYHSLTDNEKIRHVKKLIEIAKKIIDFLELEKDK